MKKIGIVLNYFKIKFAFKIIKIFFVLLAIDFILAFIQLIIGLFLKTIS